jgi:hypothetical protein
MASEAAKRHMVQAARRGMTETVLFHPGNLAGRSIQARVTRQVPDDLMHGSAPRLILTILNDATVGVGSVGIDAKTLDRGADRISVSERVGGNPRRRQIVTILEQDDDWLRLEVR